MNPEFQFAEYTAFGNTFILVEEMLTPLADDRQRAAFARWALNPDVGIGGADNVIYLSRADAGAPEAATDYVFRIFEHDGSETLSCGNGLLCTAAVLHERYGGRSWDVLTEMPSGRPRRVRVGIGGTSAETWADMGMPRAVPRELYRRAGPQPASGIDPVDMLIVPLPVAEGWARDLPATLALSGSLIFTGEPHLVLLSGDGLPAALDRHLYPVLDGEVGREPVGLPDPAEMKASSLLVDHIGKYVNARYRDRFPQGVHLDFARVRDGIGIIEYRTYERAIDRETLACGSGAVAVTYVAQQRGLIPRGTAVLWPYRCRWHWPDASLRVEHTESGFTLTGQPRLVCAGLASPPVTAAYAATAHHGRT